MENRLQKPTFAEEELLIAQGYQLIAGVDEAGRGALAGPVVAAAVILPCRIDGPWIDQVKDSKQLSPAKRELLFHNIHQIAISIGISMAPPEVAAKLHLNDGVAKVNFYQPQRAIAPGQAIVFYQGDAVLGGGIIENRVD